MNLYLIFFTYFLNIDISSTIQVINLKFSMCVLKCLLEGSVSQIFCLGPSYHVMYKKKKKG